MIIFNNNLLSDLFQIDKSIAIFIYKKKYFFILDHKEHFELNATIYFDALLKKKIISEKEYDVSKKEYRGGVLELSKDTFEKYINNNDINIYDKETLVDLLFCGFEYNEIINLYSIVENRLAYNAEIKGFKDKCINDNDNDFLKINKISSRLPFFYINFDTEIYLHMNWDRIHEDYVYPNWFAKAMDFGYLIHDVQTYWKIEGRDYWKFRQV